MKILVCIKQVPGTAQVEIDPTTGTLKRDGVPAKMNPFDLYALETAIRIRDAANGPASKDRTSAVDLDHQPQPSSVTVLTMGPPQCEKVVREAFMMGADRGVIMSDRAFGGADVLMTSYTLSQGVKKTRPYDLIICGKQTTDGDTAQVGAEMAEFLGIPHVVNVKSIGEECAFHGNAPTGESRGCSSVNRTVGQDGGCSSVNCTVENSRSTMAHFTEMRPREVSSRSDRIQGLVVTVDLPDYEIVERIPYPFLMTVEKGIFEPRLPSYKLKCATADREITWLGLKDLDDTDPKHYGLNGSPTQVKRIFPPESHVERTMLEGDDVTKAEKLAAMLDERKFLQ